jgi:UDP-glucose 4-epimerase
MDDYSSDYEGATILVTGGAGAIGGNLSKKFSEFNVKNITILDDLSSAYEWNIPKAKNITFVKGSILDDEILKRVFKDKPQYVFHLAAHFANQNSVDNPEKDLMVNGMGILKVLQYAQLTGVKRFVYSSSGCGVYGLESKMPFEEHDVSIKLQTPYQVTKLLGELYTNYFYNLYGLPIVNARFFNSYGPGEVPGKYRNVIPNFFYWAISNQNLPITGDGTETRDWTYVNDIVHGLIAMGIRDEAVGEAFNLGSGKEQRVIDLATEVVRLTGNKSRVLYTERRDWDKKTHLLSCITKSEKLLGYKPRMEFNDGLKEVHNWFKVNWESIRHSAEF